MEARPRLGITVSRKVGNAVQRNRVKRAIRQWFRQRRGKLASDADLIVIARPGAVELTVGEIDCELSRLAGTVGTSTS